MAKYNLSHQAGNVGICINKMRAVWFKTTQLQDWILIHLIKDAHSGAVPLVFLASSESPPFVSVSCVNGFHLYCLLGNSQCKQSGNTPLDHIPMLTLYCSTDHRKQVQLHRVCSCRAALVLKGGQKNHSIFTDLSRGFRTELNETFVHI